MPPAHLLISLCNGSTGAPCLALLDTGTGRAVPLRVPARLADEDPRGLAITDAFVFVATGRQKRHGRGPSPSHRCCLFTLDRRTLDLVAVHVSDQIIDAHSILAGPSRVDVVSSGTDSVVRLSMEHGRVVAESVLWRPDPDAPLADIHHLNGIALWRDDIVVSGFGRKTGTTWSTATDGFVVNIRTGERLVSGARHPHAVFADGARLLYCDSSMGALRHAGHEAQARLGGYPRGLTRHGDALFAGISRGRTISKSSGTLTNMGETGTTAGRCAVVQLEAASLTPRHEWSLEALGDEIYDVVAADETAGWPIAGEQEWREQARAGLRADLDDAQRTVAWLHEEVAKRDADLRWLHGEVAQRDRTIEWLHAEVAARDRTVEALTGRAGK